MALGGNYPLRPFLQGPTTVLGAYAFFTLSAGAGQFLYYFSLSLSAYFMDGDAITDMLPPFYGIPWLVAQILGFFAWTIITLLCSAATGIGLVFQVIDFTCFF